MYLLSTVKIALVLVSPHAAVVHQAPAVDAHQRHEAHLAHLAHLHYLHELVLLERSQHHAARVTVHLSGDPEASTSPHTSASVHGGYLTYSGLEALWEAASGPAWAAPTAACIAEHESSGQQYATGPFGERGYWQINPDHGSLSTYDPYGNARAAVLISDYGRDWSAWTTAPLCGVLPGSEPS